MFSYGLVIGNLRVILIYLGLKLGVKKFKQEKLSKSDVEKYVGYYRDILKDYSPAELSYIDNFELVPENDLVASLLSLKLKQRIDLDDSQNTIQIKNNNIERISNNEKYILNSIENGKINNFNENEFVKKVQEDAVKNGLLKEAKIDWKKFKSIILVAVSIVTIMIFICGLLINSFINNPTNEIQNWGIYTLVFTILIIVYLPFYLFIYFNTYIIKMKKHHYIRTKKGEEINENLEGLKNYLKDFSIMDKRGEKSLILWEDYLIYSIMFNQNTKIVKNMNDKFFK